MTVSIKHRGWKWSNGDASNPALVMVLDDTSKAVHVTDGSDQDTDWNVSADSNPSLYVHSSTTPATDYLVIRHNATQASLTAVGGGVRIVGAGTNSMVAVEGAITEKTTQTALTDTATVTAAQLLTKVLDGTPTAAAAYTLSTAELLVAAMPGAAVGDSFYFIINNKSTGANTITVSAGTGGTADGTLTVAQNVIRGFFVVVTNVTAATEAYFVYGLGA